MGRRPATKAKPRKRRPTAVSEPRPRPNTLGDLVSDLGPGVLEVAAAPRGLDVEVGQPVLHDPSEASGAQNGDVVLAVGTSASRREAVRLLDDAAAAGAAAVVFKMDGPPPAELLDAAARCGVAVLAVPGAVAWGQLYTLLRAAGAAPAPGPDTSGVPMGDLFALANALAAMVGGAVTIEDPQSRLVAYSSGEHEIDEARREVILGRQVPDHWVNKLRGAGVFRRLWSSEDVVRYEDPEEDIQPRLAVAVRAGGEILGSIWVAEGHEPLASNAESSLREAARIAALHLIRHRTTEDLERRRRGESLLQVLEGRVPAAAAAGPLGLDADTPVTVVAFQVEEDDTAAVGGRVARAADLVALYCESFRRQAALVTLGRSIYVLLPEAPATGRERLRELVLDIAERTSASLEVALRAGIGSTVASLEQVVRSRREADQVVRVLNGADGRRVADVDEVRSAIVLLTLRDAAGRDPNLRAGRLQALQRHDADKGTAYVSTLRAYLDTFGDIPAAAQRLAVHPNTFRYRLRRLVELSGLHLEDADERLVAELQLRFLG